MASHFGGSARVLRRLARGGDHLVLVCASAGVDMTGRFESSHEDRQGISSILKRVVFLTSQPINQSPSRSRSGRLKTMSSDGTRDGAGLGLDPVDVARGRASAPRLTVFAGAVNTVSPTLAVITLVPLTCRLQAYRPEHHVERRLLCHLHSSIFNYSYLALFVVNAPKSICCWRLN